MTNFSSTPGFEPTVTWLQTTSMLADILGLNGSNVDLPLLGRNRVNSSMEGFEPLVSWVQTATASMITDHNEEPAEDFIK